MNEEAVKLLYDDLKNEYDVGSYEDFTIYLLDDNKRQGFYDDVISSKYDVATMEDFETFYGLKKKEQIEPTVFKLEDGSSEQPTEKQEQIKETITTPITSTDKIQKYLKTTPKFTGDIDKPEMVGKPPVDPYVKSITPELMTRTEEFVVPQMNYLYNDQGFKFEETGLLNKMKVTSKSGETIKIDLGKLDFADEEIEANKLKNFLLDNRQESALLKKKEFGYEYNKMKFQSDKDYENVLSDINKKAELINDGLQNYLKENDQLSKDIDNIESMTEEQRAQNIDYIKDVEQRITNHEAAKLELETSIANHTARESDLNDATAKYFAMKGKQGSWGKLLGYKLLSGKIRQISGAVDYIANTTLNAIPMELQMGEDGYKQEILKTAEELGYGVPENPEGLSLLEIKKYYNKESGKEKMVTAPFAKEKITESISMIDEIDRALIDKTVKDVKYGDIGIIRTLKDNVLEELAGKNITKQYEALQTEGFWGGAIAGLAESLPALASPNKYKQIANLFTLTSDFVDEEMQKNSEFQDISESEKMLVKVPIAVGSALLERLGFRNVLEQKGILSNVILRALKKTPSNGTPATFRTLVREEVKSPITKAVLIGAGGTLAEAETGAAQQTLENVVKNIYNVAKEKEMFQEPAFLSGEMLGDVVYAAGQEAVGGFILSVPVAVANAYSGNDFASLSDDQIKTFLEIKNDPNISRKAFLDKLKIDINNGLITKERADKLAADYEKAIGLSNQVPKEGLTDRQYLASMDLLVREQKLKDRTDNIKPALVQADLNEIQEINKKLEDIRKTPVEKEIVEGKTLEEIFEAPEPEVKVSAIQIFFGETVPETVEKVTDNLVISAAGEAVDLKTSQIKTRDIVKGLANTGIKAINNVLPETKMVLHETNEEFVKYAPAGNNGYYDTNEDVIHINLDSATRTTVPHEIFHAVFLNKVKEDAEAAKLAEKMMNSVRKALPKNSPLAKRIDEFAASYDTVEELQNEERLAELMGIMSSEYTTLTKPQKNKVIKFIQDLAKKLGLNLGVNFTQTDSDVVDLLNTLSGKVATGEVITEEEIQTLEELDNGTNPIGNPTKIKIPKPRQQKNVFKDDYPLSLIKNENKIDIVKLTADISKAGQKVWFWVADQLGIGGEFNLDAGPSYPFGDGRINQNAVWASSLPVGELEANINKADYIYIISGSPQLSLLFNEKVYDIITNNLGSYQEFKTQALELKATKPLLDTLNAHDSWESLKDDTSTDKAADKKKGTEKVIGTGRKKFLIALLKTANTPNTSFHKYIKSLDGYIDVENLRDGFYKANNYEQNDVMLVLKPTGLSPNSNHSTYSTEILGEVIGVPDVKLDAREIMPTEMANRLAGKPRSRVSQSIAPYGVGVRKVEPPKKKLKPRAQKDIKQVAEMFNMNNQGFIPAQSNESELRKMAAALGYEVERAGYNEFGQGGGLMLKKDGKRYKIPKLGRAQKDDKYYQGKVKEARESGIKDDLIIDYLKRKEKLTTAKIKELFKIDSELLGVLPESFKSIEGGANAGLKLFLDIEGFILRTKRANDRVANPLTEKEINDKAFEFLMNEPAYKKASDKTKMSSIQARMLTDLQKVLEAKPTQNLANQLREARSIIRQRTKGVKDVKKLQQELINFMRRNLPRTIFTKSETIDLMRKVQAITPQTKGVNIENLMDEVMEVVTVKNNQALMSSIKKILDKKYEAVVSGRMRARGVDVSTNARIKNIKSNLITPGSPLENAQSKIDELNEELFNLGLNEESTQADYEKAADLQIALNYNKAMLMEADDMYMTEALVKTLAGLETLVAGGKQALQIELEKANRKYRNDLEIAWEEITGQKVDMQAPDYKDQLSTINRTRKRRLKKEKSDNKLKTFVKEVVRTVNDKGFFGSAEALDGLMDRLSKMPGEMFGGRLQELVTDKIDAATRKFKERMLSLNAIVRNTLEEYYGKQWPKLFKQFEQTDNEFYYDAAAVREAEAAYNNNKNDITKRNLQEVVDANVFELSQHQMAYLVNQYKDPANLSTFKKMFGAEYAATMKDMENKLDERVKKFSEWQVKEYYPSMYSYYNDVYKKIYRTDMPFNRYYAGPIAREGVELEPMDLLGNKEPFNTSVGSNFTKLRVRNTNPIVPKSIVNNMINYANDMEYFAAYAETIRDVDKIFSNNYIKNAITDIHGKSFYTLVDNMIKKLATKGINKATIESGGFFNNANTIFLISRLGLNPGIAIKQLTSIPTYMNDIGPLNWLKYSVKNKSEQIKLWKEVRDNSVYMQDRKNDGILRTIEAYNPESFTNFVPDKDAKNWTVDFLMSMIKYGDRTAIMLGGLPNYSYYKTQYKEANPTATEQEAIDYAIIKFEKDTKRTQQSQDLQDKDIYQNANPLSRSLNMFLTTPKQYLRKEIIAIRNLYRKISQMDAKAGKGTIGQNLRTFAMYHIMMPVIFQYVTLGLPGLLRDFRDEDDDDLIRAAVIGNLNGLFIVGQLIQYIADNIQNKPWAGQVPSIPIIEAVAEPFSKYQRAARIKDPDKRAEAMQSALFRMLEITGLPITTTKRWTDNFDKVLKGDTKNVQEDILRILNYSDYQIGGTSKEKRKKAKAKKPTQAEIRRMFPDLYEFEREQTKELRELEKDLRDLEKELLDEIFQ
jgi:uncharacterized short protein YbdD (DUF466 family)